MEESQVSVIAMCGRLLYIVDCRYNSNDVVDYCVLFIVDIIAMM